MALKVGELFAQLKLDDKDFSGKISSISSKFGSLASSATTSMGKVEDAVENAEEAIQDLEDAMDDVDPMEIPPPDTKKFDMSMQSIGQKMLSVGKTLTTAVTVPLTGVGVAMGKYAIDTESAMAKVNTLTNLSGKEWDVYEKQIKTGAKDLGLAYSDYAEATYNAISAGVDYTETTGFLTQANNLAKGGFTDLGKATDVLTTALNSYGMGAEEAGRVSDVLITTQNLGKTTVDELASSMGKIIPTANAQGVSIEQLGAGYAQLTAKGIATAEATTYMNSMLNELGATGSKSDKALRELTGKSFKELQTEGKSVGDVLALLDKHAIDSGLSLKDMFGSSEAGSAALVLAGNAGKDFNGILKEMESATGATDKASAQMDDTMKNKLAKSIANLKNTLSDFGEALLPFVDSFVNGLDKILQAFNNLSPGQQKFIVALGVVIALIPPLIMLVGGIITGFTALSGVATALGVTIGALSVPVLAVVGVIAGLIAVGWALVSNWDSIKAGAQALWDSMVQCWEGIKTSTMECWNAIKEWLGQAWENIKTTFSDAWNSMTEFLSGVWETIKNVIQVGIMFLGEIISAGFQIISLPFRFIWENCKEAVTTIWESIKTFVSNTWNTISNKLKEVFSPLVTFLTDTWNKMKTNVQNKWNEIKTNLSNKWNEIKTNATNKFNEVKTAVSNKWNEMKTNASEKWNNIKSDLGSKWDSIKSSATEKFNGIKTTVSGAWDSIKTTTSSVWNGVKSAISGVWDSIKGIVKGGVDKLKSLMNFKWELPKIKMPHFKISGKFSLNPPSVPSFGIDWYKRGGMFNSPTVVGLGEAGREGIVPFSGMSNKNLAHELATLFAETGGAGGGVNLSVDTMVVREEADIKRIAQELHRMVQRGKRGSR